MRESQRNIVAKNPVQIEPGIIFGENMHHLKSHQIKSIGLVIGMWIMSEMAWSVSAITGEGGFNLGEIFDTGSSRVENNTIEKEIVYKIKPAIPSDKIDYISLWITPSNQIHRIAVYSIEMKSTQCEIEKNSLRSSVEKKYPTLGYYAMDESEMFYEDPRSFTIECVASGNKKRLKREYSDDAIATLRNNK